MRRSWVLLCALVTGACSDGASADYVFEPFAFELAGLPVQARLGAWETDDDSAFVGMFDIGTYTYSFADQQWTRISDWQYVSFTETGLTRLASGDLVLWRSTQDGNLDMQVRGKGALDFGSLPVVPFTGFASLMMMTTTSDGSFWVGPVPQAGGLAVAKLVPGATVWEFFPLPAEALTPGDNTSELTVDATGQTVLYAIAGGGVYIAKLAPGQTEFTTLVSPATAQYGAQEILTRRGADPLIVGGRGRVMSLNLDGSVEVLPGEETLSSALTPTGYASLDAEGSLYRLADEGFSDAAWDVMKFSDQAWSVVHTNSFDIRLKVAPNGDLYISQGQNPPAGRQHR